jgi:hypothetical protein
MKVSNLTHVPSSGLLGLVTLSAIALGPAVSDSSRGDEVAAAAKAASPSIAALQSTNSTAADAA